MNKQGLIYYLNVKPNPLVINKMPPITEKPVLDIEFEIHWPNRSVWEGKCPTSQTFELEINRRGFNTLVWSKELDLNFLMVETPVFIPGPSSHVIRVQWELDPNKFIEKGTYLLNAIFLANNHSETQDFEIEIVQ